MKLYIFTFALLLAFYSKAEGKADLECPAEGIYLDLEGNCEFNSMLGSSWQECGERCMNVEQCLYWTFDTVLYNCMLKTCDDGAVEVSYGISGAKGCH